MKIIFPFECLAIHLLSHTINRPIGFVLVANLWLQFSLPFVDRLLPVKPRSYSLKKWSGNLPRSYLTFQKIYDFNTVLSTYYFVTLFCI